MITEGTRKRRYCKKKVYEEEGRKRRGNKEAVEREGKKVRMIERKGNLGRRVRSKRSKFNSNNSSNNNIKDQL